MANEVTAREQFDFIEDELRYHSIESLRTINHRDEPKETAFEYMESRMKNVDDPFGSACKEYIECASKIGTMREAKKELTRLLEIAANKNNIESTTVYKSVADIVSMYTPSLNRNTKSIFNEAELVFGEKIMDLVRKIENAESEESAIKILQDANDKDMTINFKDICMSMISAAKSASDKDTDSSNQQPVATENKNDTAAKSQPSADGNETVSMAEALLQTSTGEKLFQRMNDTASPATAQ